MHARMVVVLLLLFLSLGSVAFRLRSGCVLGCVPVAFRLRSAIWNGTATVSKGKKKEDDDDDDACLFFCLLFVVDGKRVKGCIDDR